MAAIVPLPVAFIVKLQHTPKGINSEYIFGKCFFALVDKIVPNEFKIKLFYGWIGFAHGLFKIRVLLLLGWFPFRL